MEFGRSADGRWPPRRGQADAAWARRRRAANTDLLAPLRVAPDEAANAEGATALDEVDEREGLARAEGVLDGGRLREARVGRSRQLARVDEQQRRQADERGNSLAAREQEQAGATLLPRGDGGNGGAADAEQHGREHDGDSADALLQAERQRRRQRRQLRQCRSLDLRLAPRRRLLRRRLLIAV